MINAKKIRTLAEAEDFLQRWKGLRVYRMVTTKGKPVFRVHAGNLDDSYSDTVATVLESVLNDAVPQIEEELRRRLVALSTEIHGELRFSESRTTGVGEKEVS